MALIDNLASYWKLDESSGNAADSVGSSTLTNSSITYGAAKINNGAINDGNSTKKLQGTIFDVDSYSSGVSISMWCYANAVPTSRRWTMQIAEDSSWGTCFIGTWDTGNYARLWYKFGTGESGFYGTDTGYNVPATTWFHVVITVNGTTQKCYINGALQNTATRTQTIRNNSTNFALLNDTGNSYPWDGKVDEVGIWQRELSLSDVQQLYNSGAGLQYPFNASNPKASLFFSKAFQMMNNPR